MLLKAHTMPLSYLLYFKIQSIVDNVFTNPTPTFLKTHSFGNRFLKTIKSEHDRILSKDFLYKDHLYFRDSHSHCFYKHILYSYYCVSNIVFPFYYIFVQMSITHHYIRFFSTNRCYEDPILQSLC